MEAVSRAFNDAGVAAFTASELNPLSHFARNEAIANRFQRWNIGTDCTSGGEMRSPIFRTMEDMTFQIRKACEILTRFGYTVTAACGLHVHLGTGAYPTDAVARFHQFLYRHEDDFFRLVPRNRRRNDYCPIICRTALSYIGQSLVGNAKSTWHSRYWFHYSNKDTTEIRLQLGSLDPDRIINWICFLQQCWRSSQVDKAFDPQWRVLRCIEGTPQSVRDGFATPVEGTRTAMKLIRTKQHDAIYRAARDYAHKYALVD